MFTGSPGVVSGMTEKSPLDFFRLFFSNDVMDLLFEETKRYIDQYLEREREYMQRHPQCRAHEWLRAPLVKKELDVFIALVIGMGACGFPTLRLLAHCPHVCMCVCMCMNHEFDI